MKKSRTNTIKINNKVYDAHSGLLVKSSTHASRRSVDGIKQASSQTKAPKKQTSGKSPATTVRTSTSTPIKNSRTTAPKVKAGPKRSSTLHRRAVKRPKLQASVEMQSETPTHQVPGQSAGIIPKTDAKRVQRAQKITRSTLIGRFYKASPSMTADDQPSSDKHPLTRRVQQAHAAQPVQSRDTPTKHTDSKHHAAAQRIVKKHTKASVKRKHLTSYATTAVVVLLLGGYVAYLNIPSISMKVAANRAGFAASMPHAPSGYRFSGPIAYSPGQVVVSFRSNTDERRFSLTQQPTNWDSLALLENHVLRQSSDYTTYQDRGLTIYVHGSDAAWVSDGKMYTINGQQARLGIDQILGIAASM